MNVLSMERRVAVAEHLTDSSGVRAASRLTRVHKTTILSLILKLGAGCERLHNLLVRELCVNRIECDEMHSFIHTREYNLEGGEPREWGASWLWLGIASTAKLIISYRVAETRDERDADALIKDLRRRLKTIPTISTDGLDSYVGPIAKWFSRAGGGVEYGQVVKNFQGIAREDLRPLCAAHQALRGQAPGVRQPGHGRGLDVVLRAYEPHGADVPTPLRPARHGA